MDLVINQNVAITNADLKIITKKIRDASTNVIGNTFKIAVLLSKVEDDELFVDDNFEDVFDYAKKCFDLEKTSTYNLIKAGREFIAEVEHGKTTKFETLLTHGDRDYSISQVFKMLPLGIDKARELTADGVIDENMSCREIERIVKDNTDGTKARGRKKSETSPADNNDYDDFVDEKENDEDDTTLFIYWSDLPEHITETLSKAFNLDDVNLITIEMN